LLYVCFVNWAPGPQWIGPLTPNELGSRPIWIYLFIFEHCFSYGFSFLFGRHLHEDNFFLNWLHHCGSACADLIPICIQSQYLISNSDTSATLTSVALIQEYKPRVYWNNFVARGQGDELWQYSTLISK